MAPKTKAETTPVTTYDAVKNGSIQTRVMTLALAAKLVDATAADGRYDPSAAGLLGFAFGIRVAGLDTEYAAELASYIDGVLKTTGSADSTEFDAAGFLKGKNMSQEESELAGLFLSLA